MFADTVTGLAIAFGLDLLIGWPKALYARIGHPVGWFATPVSAVERCLNQSRNGDAIRFVTGAIITVAAVIIAAAVWGGLSYAAYNAPAAPIWLGVLFWPLIAARSMREHVVAIERPLVAADLPAARHAVSMIVGRNTTHLDEAAISRATLESLGENTSDGIVAPILWGLILGPAGMAAYKAINTLDSMIAHRNARYEWFGKVAARLDDCANLIPARLTGLLYALVCGRNSMKVTRIMFRDAHKHRSPNAGWPETALAAGVGVRLSGPRVYDERVADEPWLNGQAPDPDASSIRRGLVLYDRLLATIGVTLICMAALS